MYESSVSVQMASGEQSFCPVAHSSITKTDICSKLDNEKRLRGLHLRPGLFLRSNDTSR